ncbi:hypothetical protein BCV70DRAFT_198964 [Testicularia cyperi]|uniref:RecA family profile 1 domain-containing protein n=1 Tax=Testicularia cyperi TaxID=1882483 RepID=A0A317XU05_9BASI|nr:hypothetical protein BCV70DRAFT_198964 [Testicularia cyperi]
MESSPSQRLQASRHVDATPTSRLLSRLVSAQRHSLPLPLPTTSQTPEAGPSSLHSPLRPSLRLSHPPPAPASGLLAGSQSAKRPRFNNGSPSNPLPAPVTPGRPLTDMPRLLLTSTRLDAASGPPRAIILGADPTVRTSTTPLRPLHQPSIQELQSLLPPEALAPSPDTRTRHRYLHLNTNGTHASAEHVQIPEAPVAPPQPQATLMPWRRKRLRIGLKSLDNDLRRISRASMLGAVVHSASDAVLSLEPGTDTSALELEGGGLPSGSLLEVLGPPGSGKSRLCAQMAIVERLRSLLQARRDMSGDSVSAGEAAEDAASRSAGADQTATLFAEEFWDAEMTSADQVLLIDCEGALQAESLADAVWRNVTKLWMEHQASQACRSGIADSWPQTSNPAGHNLPARTELPEVVRRLVAAVLGGIHVSRVTSTAQLLALLSTLRPTDTFIHGQLQIPAGVKSSMPPRTSLILIDSLSHHLRTAGSNAKDRKSLALINEAVVQALRRLHRPPERPATDTRSGREGDVEMDKVARATDRDNEAASPICAPTIVFTNQMGMRRAKSESSGPGSPLIGSGYRGNNGAGRSSARFGPTARDVGSMLVPQLQGQRPATQQRARDWPPAPSVALTGPEMWEDEAEGSSEPLDRGSPSSMAPASTQPSRTLASSRPRGQTHHGLDRGWAPSFLGPEVWRLLLFRHGTAGRRYGQWVSIPASVQGELSDLWTHTKASLAASTTAANTRVEPAASAATAQSASFLGAGAMEVEPAVSVGEEAAVAQAGSGASTESMSADQAPDVQAVGASDQDPPLAHEQELLDLLQQIKRDLFRWRPFEIQSDGLTDSQWS